MSAPDLLLRCTAIVAEEQGANAWYLPAYQHERYARAVAALAPADAADDELRHMVRNYHHDHRTIALLCNPQHPEHAGAWQRLIAYTQSVVYQRDLAWSSDVAIDRDDLVQIALLALQHALRRYGYRSRFRVWVHSVVVRTLHKHIRDSLRQRRAMRPASLDQLTAVDPDRAPPAGENSEDPAHLRTLYALIGEVLGAQPERRLPYLFHLAYIEDRRLSEIGALVQLSPARVRALLRQARTALSVDPTIRAWHHSAAECEYGCCVEAAHG